MPSNFIESPEGEKAVRPPFGLFDCNAIVGKRTVRNPGSVYDVDGLISLMDRFGIKRVLVSHATCEDSGPLPGNATLMSEIEGHNRLIPCWVLVPNQTGELGADSRAYLERMIESNVKAAKIYPVRHHFSLSEWCLGDILNCLEERRVPLLIDFNIVHYGDALQNVQWDELYELCRNHRDLPLILLRIGGNVNRNLFPLLGMFENLHIDISYYSVNNGIESICERFGANHLIFGTGSPVMSPAGPLSMLMYSGISTRAKISIGSGNLEKLLGSVST